MNNLFPKLKNFGLDLLFPLQCLGCQREGNLLCAQCRDGLDKLNPPCCTVCAQPSARSLCNWCRRNPLAIDGIRAPYLMQGPVQEAIRSLKYRYLQHEFVCRSDPYTGLLQAPWRHSA